jgi:NAD(P)-dependent dehydrogenase (short-subunit alcohol dehydrogenase family)
MTTGTRTPIMERQVILITGAGSGIGRLSAEALAAAGHTVYATMRDVAGRNARRAADMRTWATATGADLRPLELDVLSQPSADAARAGAYARYEGVLDQVGARLDALTPPEADPQAVAQELVRIVGLPRGQKPFRAVVDFVGDGAREVLDVAEAVRIDFARRIGIGDLLVPAIPA